MPEGYIDLNDDYDGTYGGPKLVELRDKRRAAGDFGQR